MTITETEVAYPAHLESDVVLRNGRTLRIRPVRCDDRERLRAFFTTLSPETLHARFFAMCTADQALTYAPADVDYVHDFGVVGEIGDRIVAVAHYFGSPRHPSIAEVAFAIADDQQGCGIGTLLLEKLAAAARLNHIVRFEAEILSNNARMIDVFLSSGFDVLRRSDEGTIHVSFAIEQTPSWRSHAASRAQHAAHESMKPIFEPRSIAVIGAGRRPGSVGHEVVASLQEAGFPGPIFPVNPHARQVRGLKAWHSLQALRRGVDLAVVAVPSAAVAEVVAQCATAGSARSWCSPLLPLDPPIVGDVRGRAGM